MSGRSVILGALTILLASQSPAFSQLPYTPERPTTGNDADWGSRTIGAGQPGAVMHQHSTPGPSPWIVYDRHGCSDGEMNGTPLRSEVYFQTGVSIPAGGRNLGQILQPGFVVGGGARALFFNASQDAAWTLDAGITNINNVSKSGPEFPLSIFVPTVFGGSARVNFGEGGIPGVTVREYNRTTVNLTFGREWYLWGTADADRTWRVGADLGGRYGSAKMDFNEIRHRTDVVGGFLVAGHTDYEIPCGCLVFCGGVRFEWGYTWSDILQRQSDVAEVNILMRLGVRF